MGEEGEGEGRRTLVHATFTETSLTVRHSYHLISKNSFQHDEPSIHTRTSHNLCMLCLKPPLQLRRTHLPRLNIQLPLRMILQSNLLTPLIHHHGQPHIVTRLPALAIPAIPYIHIRRPTTPLHGQLKRILAIIRLLGLGRNARGPIPNPR